MNRKLSTALIGLFVVAAVVVGLRAAAKDIWNIESGSSRTSLLSIPTAGTSLVPGTDNYFSLGSTSYKFSAIYAYDLTLSDDLVVTDDLAVTDDAAVNGDLTIGDAQADTIDINAATTTIDATWGLNVATATAGATSILFLDGANQRVGIGTTAPATTLQVIGGALRLGTGSTADVTPGADDAFIEGTLEVDGATRIDGAIDANSTLDVSGIVTLGNLLTLYSQTEAELKTTTPTVVGQIVYDSTNKAVVVGTATTDCNAWGQINAGGTAPAGW